MQTSITQTDRLGHTVLVVHGVCPPPASPKAFVTTNDGTEMSVLC